MEPLKYAINRATSADIGDHLRLCDVTFVQPLSDRVNIAEYAEKIRRFGVTFECWCQSRLVALVAAYENEDLDELFITSVSTCPTFVRQGIARKLLSEGIKFAKNKGFNSVRLEVDAGSTAAIKLYESIQFRPESGLSNQNGQRVMIRDLSR